MKLILLAEPESRAVAEQMGGDISLLTMTEKTMPRSEFINLPEFDG